MALLKCTDCGREVSDKAAACPHCGCPTSARVAASTSAERTSLPSHDSARRRSIGIALGGTMLLIGGVVAVVVLTSSRSKSNVDPEAIKQKWAREDLEKQPSVPTARPSSDSAADVLANRDAKPTPTSAPTITEAQVLRVYQEHKTDITMISPDGDPRRFFAKKDQGTQTYSASLVSMSGEVLATINTDAESDAGVIGARHFQPVAFVGAINNSLVFVGGSEKITGKAGYTLEARVFRWSDSRLVQVQKLKLGWVASASGDDRPPQRIGDQPIQALRQRSSGCTVDRALVGLDKGSVMCSVDNPNSRAFMVHVTGTMASDNLPPHVGEVDVVVPGYGSKDARIEFKDVDSGRSQNLRCVCNVTSPDVSVK